MIDIQVKLDIDFKDFLPVSEAEPKQSGVYIVKFPKECAYVGQSLNVKTRFKTHKTYVRNAHGDNPYDKQIPALYYKVCGKTSNLEEALKCFDDAIFVKIAPDCLDQFEFLYAIGLKTQGYKMLNDMGGFAHWRYGTLFSPNDRDKIYKDQRDWHGELLLRKIENEDRFLPKRERKYYDE